MKNHQGLSPGKNRVTKIVAVLLLCIFYFENSQAQVKIGRNPDQVGKASLLELESETKGLLLPRLPDTVAINALNPENGMLIYLDKIPNAGLYIRKNGVWNFLSGASNSTTVVDESKLDLNKIGGKINPTTQLGADPSTITGQILKWNGTAWVPGYESATAGAIDASATAKGILQLAGDLGGTGSTAAVPVISSGAITTAKILDLNVTDAKIATISGSKIMGNISGNAVSVTGTVGIANGGTGATTTSGLKSNLGLENVSNTSDATKMISAATQTALNLKANTSSLAAKADQSTVDLKAPLASPSFTGTVSGITSAMVGLSNVDNTTDAAKPISTATQTALDLKAGTAALAAKADQSTVDLKAPLVSPSFTGTVSGVTAAMVGLGNADNTTDAAKPISTATQTALDLKAGTAALAAKADQSTVDLKAPLVSPSFTGTVSGITSVMVGLGNVDNTTDAAKPISTATQRALDLKAGTAALAAKAEQSAVDLKAPLASPAFTGTVSGITSAMVGLGNVDNTTDVAKPISAATQTALDLKAGTAALAAKADQSAVDLKAPLASPAFTGTVSGITSAMVGLGNVDNTTDVAKPISATTQTALDLKAGTAALAAKADQSAVDLKAPLASPAFTGTVSGVTAAMVGLGNVDNTTDAAKPISAATQTALDLKAGTAALAAKADQSTVDLKAPLASPAFTGTVSGVTAAMVGLGNVDNTTDVAKPISATTQTALDLKAGTAALAAKADQSAVDLKAPLASPAFTGTVSGVTAAMVGLGNVDNTTDAAKPISAATQTALDLKAGTAALAAKADQSTVDLKAPLASPAFTGTVSGVTAAMVGLGNVDNTTDAAKPISAATQTALDLKAGTAALAAKADQSALDLKAPLASPIFTGTVSGITSAMVGLGNVNNTTDLLKPISTATQTALDLKASTANLDLKAPLASPTFTGTVSGITSAMVGLGNVNNTTDLLKPISTATQTALDLKAGTAALAAKADQSTVDLKAPLASPAFTGAVSGITSAMVGLGNVNNTTDLLKPISTATQTALDLKASTANLDLKAPLASPTFTGTVSGITSVMVGLGNVDNTTDANKPVSAATTTSLALKAPLASPTFTGTVSGITAAMVGLGNVNNTTDLLKPISTATQTALDLKASTANLDLKAPLASPTFTGTVSGITSVMVGLGNVDNTTDAAKPVSTATQTALDLKASTANLDLKAPLASPTFTGTVSGITSAMVGLGNVDNTTDTNKPVSAATATSLALKAPLASPTFTGTVSGVTATMVGLGNVDNTTDANKPVSAATATSLALKAPLASPTFTGTVSGIIAAMVGLGNVNNTTDLLKPISTATQTALDLKAGTAALAAKADQSAVDLKAPLASPTFTGTVSGITGAMVGLGNVDNTTDANKPVSAATATALALKAPLASPTFTGTVSGITAAMVGLGNVNNTTDLLKPISTATQTALDLKASTANLDLKAPLASPTFTGTVSGITAAMVGLGNVDNTTDANKPVSAATATALALKAPLASPTFTGTVSGVTATMVGLGNVDNTTDANKPISAATATALALKAPLASPTFTGIVSGITSAMVGLGNVDNTTDLLKPISTAAQTALNLKADLASPALTGTPIAPTAAVGTNTTQLATTAFVLANSYGYSTVNAAAEISTTSTTDEVAPGMTLIPGAGTYSVMFNGQYESSSAGVTAQGVTGLTAAYNQISGTATTGAHALVFGSGEIIGPGVYSVAGAGSIAGNLTLDGGGDANSVFIFKIDGALTTAAGTTVLLIGDAKACNVFWITTSSYAIGLGATTTMKGTLIAHNGAISMGAGGNLEGRLLSTAGAIGFGPDIAALPIGTSAVDFGGVVNFVLFTSSGGVGNTGSSTITGNIGTNSGAITGFETSTVNGSFFTPVVNGDALATFSVYQNGVLIANSSRTRTSSVNTADVSLQAIATVTAGQAVDIRWNTSVGLLKLRNRIFTLMRVQ